MTPNLVLPKTPRLVVYLIFALVALAIGAVSVWYTSVGDQVPVWLMRAAAVDAFVSAAPLTIAVLNINRADPNLQASQVPVGSGRVETDADVVEAAPAPPVEDPVEDVPAVASPDAAPRT